MPSKSTKPRPRAQRLPPEERRKSLVEAGIRVVAERGIGGARPSDVAAEAGVSEPTVYVYFPTREELIAAVLDEVGRFYLATTEAAFAEDSSLMDRYLNVFQAIAGSVDSHPEHARAWFNWSGAMRGKLWPRFLEAQGRMTNVMASAVRRTPKEDRAGLDLHPDDAALLVLSAGEMMVRMQLAGRSRREVQRYYRSTVRMLFPSP